jgi:hypothetical protein
MIIRRAKKEKKTLETLEQHEKLKILEDYSKGIPVSQIVAPLGITEKEAYTYIQSTLKNMLVVRETNELIRHQENKPDASIQRLLSPTFLNRVDEAMESYAFYFAETSDNTFALTQCGLDIGLPKTLTKEARMNIMKIRGQYMRSIPAVSSYIKEHQGKRLEKLGIDKGYVQRELVEQIEQLKVLATEDSKQRSNLLKSIELLGRSIGAFQDSLRVEEGSTRTGLEILMERVKGEVYEARGIDEDPAVLP